MGATYGLDSLDYLLRKQPIIYTQSADDILRSPEGSLNYYKEHAATHFPLHDSEQAEKRIAHRLEKEKPLIGAVVAPYGYGKTSLLTFFWASLEEKDFVVVPPFSFSSFPDVLTATYGWVRFKLEERMPQAARKLDDIFEEYTAHSLEGMAEEIEKKKGVARQAALATLQQAHLRGNLSLALTPLHLLRFFEAVVDLSLDSDYRGLLILPDETQNYINADFKPDANLRDLFELVTGVKTRNYPIGVVFGLPSPTRDIIVDRRDDLLQRIKDDDLHFDLEKIYDETFPEKLWDRFAKKFRLGRDADRVIEPCALQSLGQIAFRREKDLGNGPRTVTNTLREAVKHFRQSGKSYSPIDLIDDYLRGDIKFDGGRSLLVSVVSEALRSDIVDSHEKERAVKLLGAFPKGCPEEVYTYYGLTKAMKELSRRAHATLLTYAVDGFTLTGLKPTLSRSGVDEIISRFYQQYQPTEEQLSGAMAAFNTHILPILFPQRKGSKEYLIRWVKEGRQPGTSLVVVSQQPSAIDKDVLSQCDVIISHKLTTKEDIDALNNLSQDYMAQELKAYIRKLSRIGQAVLVDDDAEKVSMASIRPRKSRHGGGENST